MKKSVRYSLVVVAALLAALILGVAALWLIDNRMPAFRHSGRLRVFPGSTAEDVLAQIDSSLNPRFPSSLRRTFRLESVEGRLHPGYYYFEESATARYIARALIHGWQTEILMTFSGRIHSRAELAAKLSERMMVDEEEMLAALEDSALLARVGIEYDQLFAMIIPDSYYIYWDATPEIILKRLVAERNEYWNAERMAAAQAQGLTPVQVAILASIVSEESNKPDEYPKIASVYLTRLHRGMKLEACPTIRYIYGYGIKRVLYKYLSNPSPYNTYVYPGLPPSPIALPSKEHLEAVLHPNLTPYLYFCADPSLNGRNSFSVTLSEHNAKAAAYRAARSKRKIKVPDDSLGQAAQN